LKGFWMMLVFDMKTVNFLNLCDVTSVIGLLNLTINLDGSSDD